MTQSLEDAKFIIDIGIAYDIKVQFRRDGDVTWQDRILARKYAPPAPGFSYRIKPPETPPYGG